MKKQTSEATKKFPYVWLAIVFLGSLLAVLTVAFALINSSPAPSKQVIAIVSTSGGLCPEGLCHNEVAVYSDGSGGEGIQFTEREVTQLKAFIEESDLRNDLVPAKDFLCPSAYDGSDVSYSFPTKYGDEKFTLCTYENPEGNELIGYMQSLLQSKD